MNLFELNFQRTMPANANLRGPAILSSYPDNPQPVTVATVNRLQAVLARPVNGTNGDVLQLPLNDGDDSPQILAYLRALVENFCRVPAVREFAVSILRADQVGDNKLAAQVRSILYYVSHQMVYVRDPAGGEYVISPLWIIEQWKAGQRVYGDCDDHVLVLNSLLQSIGFETRVVGVKINETTYFDHVISQVLIDNDWQDLDPCNKANVATSYTERLIA
jgi:transglutaminase-like putative cysteine protease